MKKGDMLLCVSNQIEGDTVCHFPVIGKKYKYERDAVLNRSSVWVNARSTTNIHDYESYPKHFFISLPDEIDLKKEITNA